MVLHDPSIYPGPFTFKPERWLGDPPQVEQLYRYLVAFGKGDRVCVGMRCAKSYYHTELSLGLFSRGS